jgi:aspartate-semialdehyde dehydrogenase
VPGWQLYGENASWPYGKKGWDGYWIDAASTLRMKANSVIVLDPVNRKCDRHGFRSRHQRLYRWQLYGFSDAHGHLRGLFEKNWVEWISTMTYQSASGAGANNMRELVIADERCWVMVPRRCWPIRQHPSLTLTGRLPRRWPDPDFPTQYFGAPLAASLIPWIDRGYGKRADP